MIYLGSDHGGFDLKEKVKKWLTMWNYQFTDLGNTVYEKEDDYPHFAFRVAQRVSGEELEGRSFPYPWKDRPKGILVCRSSAGMVMAANKIKGIRAVTAFEKKGAEHSRLHNDANILALSGDWLDELMVQEILQVWLKTEFSGEERHARRIKQIADFEK